MTVYVVCYFRNVYPFIYSIIAVYVHHLGLYCILFRRFLISKINVALQLTKLVLKKVTTTTTTTRSIRNVPLPYHCAECTWLGGYSKALSSGFISRFVVAAMRLNAAIRCGSVAEWLACWTQAQKGPGSNRSCDAVG